MKIEIEILISGETFDLPHNYIITMISEPSTISVQYEGEKRMKRYLSRHFHSLKRN